MHPYRFVLSDVGICIDLSVHVLKVIVDIQPMSKITLITLGKCKIAIDMKCCQAIFFRS